MTIITQEQIDEVDPVYESPSPFLELVHALRNPHLMRRFKTCAGCGVTLPRESFYDQPMGRFGLSPRCKLCSLEQRRERQMQNPVLKGELRMPKWVET